MSKQAVINQAIALAGVLQAAYLVEQIAQHGQAPAESFNPSINSLFVFDPGSAIDVFGSSHGVDCGLRILKTILSGSHPTEHRLLTRYALGILHLQTKLSQNPDMLSVISTRLQHTAKKYAHFSSDINQISTSVAAIYQDTVSTLKFRIQVSGSMEKLQNPRNADNIRALLLAGIRSAVLWRQCGGKRWHLFIGRRRLLGAVEELLSA